MALPAAAETIQATLAPAFLISGTSVFLNFAQNRLFRVVDRIRSGDLDAAQRRRHIRRAHLLRNGIALGVLTVAFTITSAILLMGGIIAAQPTMSELAPYAFGLALVSLFGALLVVFADTVTSVRQAEQAGPDGGAAGPATGADDH